MSRFDALWTALAYVIAACLGQTRRDQVHARMVEIVREDDGKGLAADITVLATELAAGDPIVEAACRWRENFEATYGGRPASGTALRPLWDAVGGFLDASPVDLQEVPTVPTGGPDTAVRRPLSLLWGNQTFDGVTAG